MSTSQATIDFAPLMHDHWSEAERHNVERIAEFIQLLMNDHDFDAVLKGFDKGTYIQHNRGIPDGIPGLVGYLKEVTKRFPEYTYDVKRIHVDGDYVIFHSHATMRAKHRGDESKGYNIIDTWRVVDSQIADHWDAVQPLSLQARMLDVILGGRIANDNGVY